MWGLFFALFAVAVQDREPSRGQRKYRVLNGEGFEYKSALCANPQEGWIELVLLNEKGQGEVLENGTLRTARIYPPSGVVLLRVD